ncbi:MAG: UDP-forming cellulose synthase catalytic subunit, partial [Sutterella sp.]
MFGSMPRSARDYLLRHALLWRNNGAGRAAVALNLAALVLLWALVPMESAPMRRIRSEKEKLFPRICFEKPRLLDPLRILIQSLWLLAFRPSREEGSRFADPVLSLLRAAGGLINRAGDAFGAFSLKLLGGLGTDEGKTGPSSGRAAPGWLLWLLAAPGIALGVLCITQPFDLQGQIIFLSLMFCSMVVLTRIKARLTLMLLFVISIVVSGRYLWWRCTATVHAEGALDLFFSGLLLGAEIYAFIVMVLGYFQVCWVLDRKPAPLPEDRRLWPHVDVFIPSYNESLDVVKPTVYAALNLDWPADKLHIHILDDGSRPLFREFAAQAGVGWIMREEHKHAKAGNINHALTVTDGEIIVIFDCDHVPSSDFLTSTVGWLVKDPKIALVQTPHHFYSPDPFEKNLHLEKAVPIENSLFHDFIQKGNDTWNATMFCGSSAVMRRKALEEIGGIAVETVTEDAHTSLKLNRRGWSSAFIDRPVASGLSTETLSAHIGQRIRWARGMIQIFRLDNPLFGRGLSFAQRLCFFNAMVHFLHGLPRIVFLLAPLPYMFADIYIIYATAAAIFAYVIPHMVHSAVTNQMLQRGYRYPFLSGVYETVLSWYILIPTTVALILPHVGTFNVTAKGSVIDRKYLDWGITKPFLVMIALNGAGLLIGLWKLFFDLSPEYLTLAINIGWIVYNLMILGASMACAVEEVQKHRFPRIALCVPAVLETPAGDVTLSTREYSQTEVRLEAAE